MNKIVRARDLMSRPVCQLQTQTPVRDAAAFLLRHGISGAPVLDEHGQWVGVFTQNDLARYVQNRLGPAESDRTLEARETVVNLFSLPPEQFGETPVREFMTAGMFTVFPEATMDEVIHTMTSFKIHRVFVIDERDGSLQGVITSMDILRRMDARSGDVGRTRKTQRV
jgi:CBS-domain-containing membrane protein